MAAPWTRLQGSGLRAAAEAAYRANALPYHDIGHVDRLYHHADRLGLPYDRRLDECILAHDVVMGLGLGENERASAEWLLGFGRSAEWAAPILDTIRHRPREDRAGLALLDLMDFTDASVSRRNTELLRREAIKRQGHAFDQRAWLMGTMTYLEGLRDGILDDLVAVPGAGAARLGIQEDLAHPCPSILFPA